MPSDPIPVMVFDSYYTTAESVDAMNSLEVPFISSLRLKRFPDLEGLVTRDCQEIKKPGQSQAYYNAEDGGSFIYNWDIDSQIEKSTLGAMITLKDREVEEKQKMTICTITTNNTSGSAIDGVAASTARRSIIVKEGRTAMAKLVA